MKKTVLFVFSLLTCTIVSAQVKTTLHPNGQKASEGILLHADATVLSAGFENLPKDVQAEKLKTCVKDGKWVTWYPDGQISSEEFYNNGLYTGIWKGYYPDGKPSYQVNFETGQSVNWFANGQKQSEGKVLSDMKQDGRWITYFEDGKTNADGNYKNGLKDGVWIFYDATGKKTAEQTFKDGNLVQTKYQ